MDTLLSVGGLIFFLILFGFLMAKREQSREVLEERRALGPRYNIRRDRALSFFFNLIVEGESMLDRKPDESEGDEARLLEPIYDQLSNISHK